MANTDRHPILGAGLNQVQALRDALTFTLSGRALTDLSAERVVNWLHQQGLTEAQPSVEICRASGPSLSNEPLAIVAAAVDNHYRCALGPLGHTADAISSSLVNPTSKFIGLQRSGAGFYNGAAFCVTSAFVRLLGASEQFELDVLKALLYYRPGGKPLGPDEEQDESPPDLLDVLTEAPTVRDNVEYFSKPALWTWIRGPAQGNDERRKIFSRVYRLELTPGHSTSDRRKHNERRKEWYEKRNKIAHGRAGVEMTLAEYLDADAFITTSMLHVARECRTQQKLAI